MIKANKREKVVEILVDRIATDKETEELFIKYPDLKRLIGSEYIIRKDKTGSYYVVNDSRDVELGVGLFVAISRINDF